MRVLVTGGAGFIGSHLVDRLLKEGHSVRVLDNLARRVHPRGVPAYLSSEAEFLEGDVTNRRCLESALQDVDVVFHQAAYQDYMPDFSNFFRVNGAGTAQLFETIVSRRFRVRRIIVGSSQAVYGEGQYRCLRDGLVLPRPRAQEQLARQEWEVKCPDCGQGMAPQLLDEAHPNPFNAYGVSKYAGERAALGLGWLHGIPTVALRYSITQGPRQSLYNHYSGICRIFCSRAVSGQPVVVYEDGKQTRDFVHVDDVVEANMLAFTDERTNFEAYNVGSGRATTVLEYARHVGEALGKAVEIRIPGAYRRGDNRHSVSGVAKLSALGWKPRHGLGKILEDVLAWIAAIGGIPADIPDAYEHMQREGVVCHARAKDEEAAAPVSNA